MRYHSPPTPATCVCVCVSLLSSDIPVQNGEAVSSAAERQTYYPTQNLIRKSCDLLRRRRRRRGCSSFSFHHISLWTFLIREFQFWEIWISAGKSHIFNNGFLEKHPLVATVSSCSSSAIPSLEADSKLWTAEFWVWECFWREGQGHSVATANKEVSWHWKAKTVLGKMICQISCNVLASCL